MTYLDDIQNIKTVLIQTVKQTNALATGLQNAAPPEQNNLSPSVEYLFETSAQLEEKLNRIEQLIEELSK